MTKFDDKQTSGVAHGWYAVLADSRRIAGVLSGGIIVTLGFPVTN